MATSVSNVKVRSIGGGLQLINGQFTTTAGSAPFTYAVSGGYVGHGVQPLSNVGTGAAAEPFDPTVSLIANISISGGIITLTINGSGGAITNGSFWLIVDNGG